ncbi:MAG: TIGR04282 family arsenosugar biosynthesis glycosyltransferase [Oscillochloridaceae bacterium umkhey_bin13]
MLPSLLIMAKHPRPGGAKTRLCPPLTPGQAARVADALLRETLALARRVPGVQVGLATTPDEAEANAFFADLAPDLLRLPQGPGDLGIRLAHVTGAALAAGAPAVAALSSDSPSLPVAYLSQAFAALAEHDLSIGPTEDGGYYLAALRQPAPSLFTRPPMSHPDTFARTLAVATDLGLRVAILPTWYDVDTFEDLQRLAVDPGLRPHLRATLADLDCGF